MIKKIFREKKFLLTDHQVNQLQRYYQILIEWNQKMNLTAITNYEEVIQKHFLDSSMILRGNIFTAKANVSVLDLGTGAGFPGIVLSILYPNDKYTLIDSLNKRILFLQFLIDELQLNNVDLYHARAEDLGRENKFRNQYDFVLSRAVAELPVLLEFCIPFVKVGGYFISYKGKKFQEEVNKSQNAMEKLECFLNKVEDYEIIGEKRYLLYFKKDNNTNNKYPRKAGKVKKNPL